MSEYIIFFVIIIAVTCTAYFCIRSSIRKREIARKRQELLDSTDELTQISNTSFMDEMLARELERAKRIQSSISFVIFEIDNFETLRQEFGRQFSRRILKDTAENLQEKIRAYDVLARDKHRFLCLFPETGREAALLLCKRARAIISAEKHYFRVDGEPINVTATIGATSCLPGPDSDVSIKHIHATAERALESAKQKGRDRLEFIATGGD